MRWRSQKQQHVAEVGVGKINTHIDIARMKNKQREKA